MEPISYKTVSQVAGPLLFVDKVQNASYGEMVEVTNSMGERVRGQVLDSSAGLAVIQVFGATLGLSTTGTSVRFLGETARISVSDEMLGRTFDGLGNPRDGGPGIIAKHKVEIVGSGINPYSREEPSEFIQTGISSIDGMNTLVRGQKLPLFSAAGLPHNVLAAQIARQAKVLNSSENFSVVFAAMGITSEEANFFIRQFEETGALQRTVLFLNLSSDPAMERILTPRLALTTAEYLAYEKEMHVLVIYERAGKIKGRKGSITQIPILTMPADDKTHPIPDLTGYITEGQIYVSRDLDRSGIYPPIDVLESLSRLMNQGIGPKRTREDHRGMADQLYASYAQGKDVRALSAIVGEEALSETDRKFLQVAERFEKMFVRQGLNEDRSIEQTLDLGWEVIAPLSDSEIKRIKPELIEKYRRRQAPK